MIRGDRTFVRVVGGREVENILSEIKLEIQPEVDLDDERSVVAADIGTVGGLMADVVEEQELADAEYRAWRAAQAQKLLAEVPGIAEWKVKVAVESQRAFLEHKELIARLEGDQEYLHWYLEALRRKADKLESIRRRDDGVQRAERAARAPVTNGRRGRDEVEVQERRRQVAAIMGKND